MNIIFWQLVVPPWVERRHRVGAGQRLVELRHRAGQAGVVEDKRIVVAGSNNLEGADRAARQHLVDQVEVVLLYQAVAALRCPVDRVAVVRRLRVVRVDVEPQHPAEAARQHQVVQLFQVGQVEVAPQHQVVVGSNSLEEDKRIAEAVRAALRHPVGRAVAEQQLLAVVVLRHLAEAVRRLRVEVALQRRVEPQHPVVRVAVVEDNKPVVDRRTVVVAGSQVEERIAVVEPCPRTA